MQHHPHCPPQHKQPNQRSNLLHQDLGRADLNPPEEDPDPPEEDPDQPEVGPEVDPEVGPDPEQWWKQWVKVVPEEDQHRQEVGCWMQFEASTN